MSSPGMQHRAAAFMGAPMLRAIGRTLRFELQGAEYPEALRASGQPIIFVFWHAWILPLAILHRDEGVVVLVSEHGDGEYVAQAIQRMGFETARGSSTRGGVRGARGIVRALRSGRDAAITPDGPKGPPRVFKPGGLVAAQLTGAPVMPVAVETDAAWHLDSWDGFAIPRPMGRIRVRYGPPLVVPRRASNEELATLARDLGALLNGGEANS